MTPPDFWSSGPSLVELDTYGDFAPERREHNDHCCMEGAWPGWGPHPDCPGVEALNEAYATAKAENDFAADLGPEA